MIRMCAFKCQVCASFNLISPWGGEAMKARRLIESASLSPDTLQVTCRAFDDAWASISDHYRRDEEDARLRLAHAVLLVAREDSQDPDGLKNDALQVMAKAYRDRP